MTGETLVVMNPASAGGSTVRRWPAMAAALRDAGISFDLHQTSAPGDATDAVRHALAGGCRSIAVAGGDGTLNEVVNGFFDPSGAAIAPEASLGVLPSGSGGDFARTAGIPRDPRAAARLIATRSIRRIDAGRIDYDSGSSRHFVNIADCGMGGEVVARVNASSHKGGGVRGSAVFLGLSLSTLVGFVARRARVDVDGRRFEGRVRSVVVANGQYFGGGMRVAPTARLDDGLFDIVIVGSTGRVRAVTGIPSLYRGRHLQRHEVLHRTGRVVRVECDGAPMLFDVEGEQTGATPATLTCLPGAIRLCAPVIGGGRRTPSSC